MDETVIHDSRSSNEDYESVGTKEKSISQNYVIKQQTFTTFIPTKMNFLEIDVWDVKKLEQEGRTSVQQPEPSAAIQRMLELRKKRHELSNSNMLKDIGIINEITDKCFTKISDHFKNLLESFKISLTEMENTLYNQIHQYMKQDFTHAMDDAKKLFAYRRNILDLYCQRVMQVEQIRTEKIKLVLRFYMNTFNKILHHLPHEIQSFFEYQILKYNETMLENVRCYGEIHLQLVMTGDSQFLKLKRKIDYLEYQWDCLHNRPKDRSSVSSDVSRRRHSGANATYDEDQSDEIRCNLKGDSWTQLLFQGIICRWAEQPDIPHALQRVKEWSEQLLRILMHLDLCAQKIIYLTKNALLNLLRGTKLDFGSLQYSSLAEDFYRCFTIDDVNVIFAAIISKIKEKILLEPTEFGEVWVILNLVLLMEQNNDITRDFLTNASKLWDSHFERLEKCSRLVASGINRLNYDRKEIDGLEMLFNIEVDRLRQESDIEKLGNALQNVYKSLDKIGDFYDEACEAELEILKSYPLLVEIELGVFQAELEQFLIKHPKVEVSVDLHDSQEENLTVEVDERKGDKIPPQIRMCIFQLEAIENWKLGLYECMEHYTSTCRDDILEDAKSWQKEMAGLSYENKKLKKQLLVPRYERVRLEVHNVRLVELQQHRASLAAHKLAVDKYLSDIMDNFDKFSADQINRTIDFVANLDEFISERDMNALVSNQVSFLIKKTDVDIGKFVSRINGFVLDMQEDCLSTVKWLKERTVHFMKSIKMFSEGGNYSAVEAKDLLQELTQVDKFLGTQGGTVISKLAAEGSALLKKVREMLGVPQHFLKNLYGDLILIEKTSMKMKSLKTKMETEVSFLKKGSEVLNEMKSDIETIMTTTPYPVEVVLEKWYELVDKLQQRNEYLLKSEGSKAKLTTVSLDVQQSTPSSSDYRYFLGWEKPAESDSFLDCVRLNLWDVFGEIQDLAHKFYLSKPVKDIVKTDRIPPSFRAFMDELLEKCKFYLIQCEEAWLDQLREYLVLVTQIREMANSFIKLAIEGFRNHHVGKLHAVRSAFLSNFALKSEDQARQLAEMDRSLMTLYGYPGNTQMLADLNAQVMKGFENLVKPTLEDFLAHREHLKETQSTYEPSLNDVLSAISEFCEKVFDMSLSERVALQLEEVCEDSIKIIEMDSNLERRPISAATKTEGSTSSEDEMSLIEIPSDSVIRKEIPAKYKLHITYNSLLVKKIYEALKNILNKNVYFNKEVLPDASASLEELLDQNSEVDMEAHVNSIVSLQTVENDYETGIYFVKQWDINEIVSYTSSVSITFTLP